jgi:hypothetical protein
LALILYISEGAMIQKNNLNSEIISAAVTKYHGLSGLNTRYFFLFLVGLGFESRALCKADTLLLEPHLQSFCSVILEMDFHELYAWLGLESKSS